MMTLITLDIQGTGSQVRINPEHITATGKVTRRGGDSVILYMSGGETWDVTEESFMGWVRPPYNPSRVGDGYKFYPDKYIILMPEHLASVNKDL